MTLLGKLHSPPFRQSSANQDLAFVGFTLLAYLTILGCVNYLNEARYLLAILNLTPSLWLLSATLFWVRRFPGNSDCFQVASKACWRIGIAAMAIAVLLCPFDKHIHAATADGYPDSYLSVVNLVLLVPFAEEYFFRGLVFDHLVRNLGKIAGVVLVSGLFAFMHAPQGIYIQMFIFSVLLCLVTLKTKSVLPGTVIHLVWNLIVFCHQAGKGL